MEWALISILGFFFVFYLLAHVGAALYDPDTGKRLPEKGKWARIAGAILEGLPFLLTL
ncbi:MAG TPA: hypothetical protein VJN43_16425 [Bryobacteraceae bacterium]|nr:hypothetical protein [Bryobacteraceae bacterium]